MVTNVKMCKVNNWCGVRNVVTGSFYLKKAPIWMNGLTLTLVVIDNVCYCSERVSLHIFYAGLQHSLHEANTLDS